MGTWDLSGELNLNRRTISENLQKGILYAKQPQFLHLLFMVALISLQVHWSLASMIVVVESQCGLDSLRRSAKLQGYEISFTVVAAIFWYSSWIFLMKVLILKECFKLS